MRQCWKQSSPNRAILLSAPVRHYHPSYPCVTGPNADSSGRVNVLGWATSMVLRTRRDLGFKNLYGKPNLVSDCFLFFSFLFLLHFIVFLVGEKPLREQNARGREFYDELKERLVIEVLRLCPDIMEGTGFPLSGQEP